MFVLWQGRTQESRLQIQDCDMFKLQKRRSLESGCVDTRTHTRLRRMQMNPVLKSLVETVWCMAVRDVVEDGHCDCIEKHDGSSEHRDESNLTEVPEHPDESKFTKIHQERRDGSKFTKIHQEHRDGSKFTKIHQEHRDGSTFKTSHHEYRDGSKIKKCHHARRDG